MSILDQFDGSAVPSRVRIYLRGGNVEASMLLSRRQVKSLGSRCFLSEWARWAAHLGTQLREREYRRYRSDRAPSENFELNRHNQKHSSDALVRLQYEVLREARGRAIKTAPPPRSAYDPTSRTTESPLSQGHCKSGLARWNRLLPGTSGR